LPEKFSGQGLLECDLTLQVVARFLAKSDELFVIVELQQSYSSDRTSVRITEKQDQSNNIATPDRDIKPKHENVLYKPV